MKDLYNYLQSQSIAILFIALGLIVALFAAKFCSKKHILYFGLSLYAFIVLLFSFIYFGMFIFDVTSFSISEQMNKHVYRFSLWNIDKSLNDYHSFMKDKMPISIESFNVSIKTDINKADSLTTSLNLNLKEIDKLKLTRDSLYKIADNERSYVVEQYKDSMLFVYQQRIDSLTNFLKGKDSVEMIILGKYVELANLKLDYSRENAKVSSYVLKHWGSIIPDTTSDKLIQLDVKWEIVASENKEQEIQRKEIARKIAENINLFLQNRSETLGLMDFLYYSICVSTTASFGDIAPNSSWTRLIAIIELLLCLLLVGFIIDRFNKHLSHNRD